MLFIMSKFRAITIGGLALLGLSCGRSVPAKSYLDEAWDEINRPEALTPQYETELSKLPTFARVSKSPWTDSYWPSYERGIAHRWVRDDVGESLPRRRLSKNELLGTYRQSVRKLSPAEKYDIYLGRYDYPLTMVEERRTSPDAPTWEGLCHGWAPAAINFSEPHSIEVTNPDGLKIQFGASDVKALLTYVQQSYIGGGESALLGRRCNTDLNTTPGDAESDACRDVNAGSFHIILTNFIGVKDKSFVADVTRDLQVWNQPVIGYQTQELDEVVPVYADAAPGTARIVSMQTTMEYIVEMGAAWDPLPLDRYGAQLANESYRYYLELDSNQKIIGGKWVSSERPDFLWRQEPPTFTGYFAGVAELFRLASAEAPSADPVAVSPL